MTLKPYDFVFCPTEDISLCYLMPDKECLEVNNFAGSVWFNCDKDGRIISSEWSTGIRQVFPATEEMRVKLNEFYGIELPDILPEPLKPFKHSVNFEAVKRLFLDTFEASRLGKEDKILEFMNGSRGAPDVSDDTQDFTVGGEYEVPVGKGFGKTFNERFGYASADDMVRVYKNRHYTAEEITEFREKFGDCFPLRKFFH